jgi:hypothetical protein
MEMMDIMETTIRKLHLKNPSHQHRTRQKAGRMSRRET